MQHIVIEWLHLDKKGNTCERCAETGAGVSDIVRKLNTECAPHGVTLQLKETKLSEAEIGKRNLILVNGIAIESILGDAQASTSSCGSCSDLTGKEASCRTLVHFGQVFETIPQQLVRKAVCEIAQCC